MNKIDNKIYYKKYYKLKIKHHVCDYFFVRCLFREILFLNIYWFIMDKYFPQQCQVCTFTSLIQLENYYQYLLVCSDLLD